jgi:hypothetical protein
MHQHELPYLMCSNNEEPWKCELSLAQLVRFLVVEPVHLGLSPRLGMGARIFLNLFQDLTALCFQW